MTVQEYKLYKETGALPWYKNKAVREFYMTNPTYEQENLRSQMMVESSLFNLFAGVIAGIGIGVLIGAGLVLSFV